MPDRLQALRAAVEHLEHGRFGPAAELCRPMLARDSADLDARFLLGLALGGLGQGGEAIRLLSGVVRERPGHPDAHRELARLLQGEGKRREAESEYRAAIRATPRDALTLCGFGRFLNEDGRADEAAALAEAALAIQPNLSAALNLLGVARVGQGRMGEAVDTLRRAAAADPRSPSVLSNLGTALATEGRFEESIAASTRALALAPADVTIRLNRAMALLKSGNFADGWVEYEWRHRKPGREKLPPALRLPSQAEPGDLAGRRIVVHHEEGFGDTIQFVRYLPMLARAGAELFVWMPEQLAGLVRPLPGIAQLLSGDVTLSEFDFHCPIMSLPLFFKTVLETVPADIPYIHPDPELVRAWAAKLPPLGPRRIGLAWSGEPRPYDLAAIALDRRRSIALAMLAPLAETRGVSFVSLQMGAAAAQVARPPGGMEIHDPMGGVRDFADTAAIIANLDMVISVDTAVAHLAGAMGKPVFLLDRYDNCWRWLAGRSDSPWYPTMRIFRQERMGEWAPVIARTAAALKQEVGR